MKKVLIVVLCIILMFVLVYILDKNVVVEDNKVNIVTSFYPVYIATLNITDGVDNVSVTNLTDNVTGCLHDYTLTTEQMVALSKCDAFIINGAGMEGFMDKVISNYSNLDIIDSSKNITLITDTEHNETNSHIFASVSNNITQVKNITEGLCKIDSKNKELYEDNANKYILELESLQKEITECVSNVENKNIVTFHESFDYFAKEFNLNVVATIEEEHGKMPSAKEVANITEQVKSKNVKAIFVEPDSNVKLAETIAKEAGAKVYTLNPVTSGKQNQTAYIDIMKGNIEVLKEAL